MQAGDLKKGGRIEIDGEPYTVTDLSRRSPSARGAATMVTVKMKSLRTRQTLTRNFKATDDVVEADFEIRPWTFLYSEGMDVHHFMDEESYHQFALPTELIETELGFMLPNTSVRAMIYNEACIGVEVESTVVLEVVECDPGIKGDTVTNTTKTAKLETGLEIQVPLFIEQGDRLQIDTRDVRYLRRD